MTDDLDRRKVIAGLGIGATAAAAALAAADPASAQTGPSQQPKPAPTQAAKAEGIIAYLQSELGLTDQQRNSPTWLSLVAVIRQNGSHRDRETPLLTSSTTAIAYLSTKLQLTTSLVNDSQSFLKAFTPFYNSLESGQKQAADGVFSAQRDL